MLFFFLLDVCGDVKVLVLDYILGFFGFESGKKFFYENEEYLRCFFDLIRDLNFNICRDVYFVVVNLLVELVILEKFFKYNIVKLFLSYVFN